MFDHFQFRQLKEASKEDDIGERECCEDPVKVLKELFVDLAMRGRIASGQYPVTRPVFHKPHGVVRGTFTINPDLQNDLRIGVFKYESLPAWVRFSSDTNPFEPDLMSPLGIGIKLFGVAGSKLLEYEQAAITHDFVLQNHDVFFAETAVVMCEWAQAKKNGSLEQFNLKHPNTPRILQEMKRVVNSVLNTIYWSAIPYAFGSNSYVKYKLEPECDGDSDLDIGEMKNDPNYLRQELRSRLVKADASFRFYLQFQTNPEQMPLDEATVRWDEALSKPVLVARLTIPRQDIDARGQSVYGDNLAYNPWHALKEHAPVGSIAEARKLVYRAAAELRRNSNGIPIAEPRTPRPI